MKRSILMVILLLHLIVCLAEEKIPSEELNYVRIGVCNSNPLIYIDNSGDVMGLYADVLDYIASRENWEIEYIPGSWQDCLNRLELNQINILPAIAYSIQREDIFDFSQETVIMDWGQIFTGKNKDINSFLDLDERKVGVLANDIYYIGEKGLYNIEQSYELDFSFVEYNSYNAIFEALESEEIEAGVFNRLYRNEDISETNIKRTALIFNPIEIKFAFSKGISENKLFIEIIDKHLRELKNNKNSIYYTSQQKYIKDLSGNPKDVSLYFLVIIFVLTIGFFLFIVLNRYLKRQIKKRSTALKQSEDQYHNLYNMFRLSIDNVQDMIWAKDLNNEYMFVNKALCNTLLKAKDTLEPVGRTDSYFGKRQRQLYPEDPNWFNFDQVCSDSDNIILKNRKAQKFEESGYVEGKYLILDVRKAPFWDDNNQLIGTVGSARVITKEKKLEEEKNNTLQALHERELFNFALFEYNPVETIVVDKEARVIKINQAVKIRRSHAPKLGDIMYTDFAGKYSINMTGELLKCINENRNRTFPEIVYGNGKIFSITFSPFLSGAIITSRDITQQKKSETQLKALNNVFENLGTDPQQNINLITTETAKILNGVCSLYNRLDDKNQSLCVWSEFNTPEDLLKEDIPEGHICYEATIKGKNRPVIINDLTGTKYEQSDINVKKYGLKAYLGYPVALQGTAVGALCIVDVKTREFTDNEVYIISTLAKAISIEEERYSSKKDLQNSLAEKEILLKEIHHRVKNNMQIISSLLSLQSKNLHDEKIMALFKESQNRVKSMALIHEKLYSESNFAKIDIASYIKTLLNYLFRNFSTLSADIKLEVDTEDILLDIDTAVPCGLILNELVSNSLKYAFPDNKKGMLKVSFKQNKDICELIVKDNGIGIPENLDINKTSTLGFQLVKALTEQLHGNFELRLDSGTEVIIRFKI
ncbi:histidine kinase dimerization/phosphoacceptor domain -containing protein [Candidatus Cloacimonadota bacterium]